MTALTDMILELDAANDFDGLIRRVASSGAPVVDLLHPIYLLLTRGRFRSAGILRKLCGEAAPSNPVFALAQSAGGLFFGDAADSEAGNAMLAAIADASGAERNAVAYASIHEPTLRALVSSTLTARDPAVTLRCLDILRAAVPEFRRIFDLDAPVAEFDPEAAREAGRERARLIDIPPLPPKESRVPRRAVVAVRALIYPNQDWSRPLDLGPRLAAGARAYGWEAEFTGLLWRNVVEDFQAILDAAARVRAEVVFIDDQVIETPAVHPLRAEMIARLRATLPGVKIVGVHFDTWQLNPETLAEQSALLDLVWEATSPTLPIWSRPEFKTADGAEKVLHTQYPHAWTPPDALPPPRDRAVFAGGVKGYNWHRALWSAAIESRGLPVEQRLSTHADDGLPALDSYRRYMDGLAEATRALNFSMRSDLTRIVTGRCFEAPAAGALLIQEDTPDLDHYLVAGEHYLSFTTFSELRSILRFIVERPDEAEEIRRRGAEFAHRRFSDEAIMGHLDAMLHRAD